MARFVYVEMSALENGSGVAIQSLTNGPGFIVFALPSVPVRLRKMLMSWNSTPQTYENSMDGMHEQYLIPYFVGATNLDPVRLKMRFLTGYTVLVYAGGASMDIPVYNGVSAIRFTINMPDYATLNFLTRAVLLYEVID